MGSWKGFERLLLFITGILISVVILCFLGRRPKDESEKDEKKKENKENN